MQSREQGTGNRERARYRALALHQSSSVALLGALLFVGCGNKDGFVRAFKIENKTQSIGGPSALAEVGDFMIENDKIRIAVLKDGNSMGPGVFGGSLVDADLRRPEDEFRGGKGLDQWGEIFPTANLIIPHPIKEGTDFDVFVLAGGNSPGCTFYEPFDQPCAIIRVEGSGDNFMSSLSPLAILLGKFSFRTDYVIRPGQNHVEIITAIDRVGDFDVDAGAQELNPFPDSTDLLGVMIGADDGNPLHANLSRGVATGDFVIFGKRTSIFSDGVGFDEDSDLTDVLLTKGNPIATPFEFPYLVADGDRVSYGYVSLGGGNEQGGSLLIPIFTSAVTVAFTHGISCLQSAADNATCDNVRFFEWRRAFIVGEGDAGSVLDEIYKIRQQATGRIAGVVTDKQSGKAISGAQVFAFENPLADPARANAPECAPLKIAFEQKVSAPFSALIQCARLNRVVSTDLGAESEMKTDVGTDPERDGDYSGPLLPGDYFVVAWQKHRLPSDVFPITITANQTAQVNLSLEPAGQLQFKITDERGDPSPGKITIIGLPCDPAQDPVRCDPLTKTYGPKRLVFGDSLTADGISEIERTLSGDGLLELEPGKYKVLISRGFEYSLEEFSVDIPVDDRPIFIEANLNHVVDTTGWISGDFHVHGAHSFDSGLDDSTRVTSYIVEGIDLLSSSDHDFVTDFGPAVRALGAEDLIQTEVGLESTTLELGHYIGFPLVVDDLLPQNGAIDWTGFTPGQIMESLRALGALPPDDARQQECAAIGEDNCGDAVVMVPHPRDGFFGYFDQYGLDPITLGVDPGFFQVINPLQKRENFSKRFDAIELLNGKRFDFLRRPTIKELADFDTQIKGVLANSTLTRSQKHAQMDELSRLFVPRVLVRTQAEQQALDYGRDSRRQCVSNDGCNIGSVCDPHTAQCVQEVVCAPGSNASCNANQVCDPVLQRCVAACNADNDCRPDEICNLANEDNNANGILDPGEDDNLNELLDFTNTCIQSKCNAIFAAQHPDRPCPEQDGVVEDWFRFLNFNIKTIGMASSDSHDLAGIEAGLPRTFICSDAQSPAAIKPEDVAAALKAGCAYSSMGPIVDFTINDKRLGSLVAASGAVSLRIKVQTPGWFDVTRIEVYRNGEFIKEFAIPAPNAGTVAFDQTFDDTPLQDSWYSVVVLGDGITPANVTDGGIRNMSPVYTSVTTPNIAIGEALSAALASVTIAGLRLGDVLGDPPPFPQVAPVLPYAVTNPIYVDKNQNGIYDAPGQGAAFLFKLVASGFMKFPLSGLTKRAPTMPDDFMLDLRYLTREHRWLEMISHHGRFK